MVPVLPPTCSWNVFNLLPIVTLTGRNGAHTIIAPDRIPRGSTDDIAKSAQPPPWNLAPSHTAQRQSLHTQNTSAGSDIPQALATMTPPGCAVSARPSVCRNASVFRHTPFV